MTVQDLDKLEYDLTFNCYNINQLKKVVNDVSDIIDKTNCGYCHIVLNVKYNDRNSLDIK